MPRLILLCGRYEGVDERFLEREVDEEISIGDYVLSGGELAAAVVIDAVARLQDGALNDAESGGPGQFRGRPAGLPALHPLRRAWVPAACRRCCCPATMPRSPAGAASKASGRTWLRRPDLLAGRGPVQQGRRACWTQFQAELARPRHPKAENP